MRLPSLARATTLTALATAVLASQAAAQLVADSRFEFAGGGGIGSGDDGLAFRFSGEFFLGTQNTGSFTSLNGLGGKYRGKGSGFALAVGPQPVPAFVLAMTGPSFEPPAATFDLREVLAGTYGQDACRLAPAVGQTCTPLGPNGSPSPLMFENVVSTDGPWPIGSVLRIGMLAGVREHGNAPLAGIFELRFRGEPYQEVLARLQATGSAGGDLRGTFVATVTPEPGSWALMATGLLGVGAVVRRRRPR